MLHRHLQDLEQTHLERFRQQTVLTEDAFETKLKDAKAIGAFEVYRYLIEMDEEDINHAD